MLKLETASGSNSMVVMSSDILDVREGPIEPVPLKKQTKIGKVTTWLQNQSRSFARAWRNSRPSTFSGVIDYCLLRGFLVGLCANALGLI